MAKAPACAYVLKLGRGFGNISPSGYEVCVTPTQALKLFGTTRRPKTIGCGVFACAFEHRDPAKVVKITRDPSDVAGLIQSQGLRQVPKLYDSHKLAGTPHWISPRKPTYKDTWPKEPTAYALTLERLQPLVGLEKARWNERIKRMALFQQAETQRKRAIAAGTNTAPEKRGVATTVKYTPPTVGEMAEFACMTAPAWEVKSCQLRVRELNKMSADLLKRGVDWADIHAGNIGADKDGRWKALDLGNSPTTLKQEPPVLNGLYRKRC